MKSSLSEAHDFECSEAVIQSASSKRPKWSGSFVFAEAWAAYRGPAAHNTLHQPKTVMADLPDAFIALPGGLRTLEETFGLDMVATRHPH